MLLTCFLLNTSATYSASCLHSNRGSPGGRTPVWVVSVPRGTPIRDPLEASGWQNLGQNCSTLGSSGFTSGSTPGQHQVQSAGLYLDPESTDSAVVWTGDSCRIPRALPVPVSARTSKSYVSFMLWEPTRMKLLRSWARTFGNQSQGTWKEIGLSAEREGVACTRFVN